MEMSRGWERKLINQVLKQQAHCRVAAETQCISFFYSVTFYFKCHSLPSVFSTSVKLQ